MNGATQIHPVLGVLESALRIADKGLKANPAAGNEGTFQKAFNNAGKLAYRLGLYDSLGIAFKCLAGVRRFVGDATAGIRIVPAEHSLYAGSDWKLTFYAVRSAIEFAKEGQRSEGLPPIFGFMEGVESCMAQEKRYHLLRSDEGIPDEAYFSIAEHEDSCPTGRHLPSSFDGREFGLRPFAFTIGDPSAGVLPADELLDRTVDRLKQALGIFSSGDSQRGEINSTAPVFEPTPLIPAVPREGLKKAFVAVGSRDHTLQLALTGSSESPALVSCAIISSAEFRREYLYGAFLGQFPTEHRLRELVSEILTAGEDPIMDQSIMQERHSFLVDTLNAFDAGTPYLNVFIAPLKRDYLALWNIHVVSALIGSLKASSWTDKAFQREADAVIQKAESETLSPGSLREEHFDLYAAHQAYVRLVKPDGWKKVTGYEMPELVQTT